MGHRQRALNLMQAAQAARKARAPRAVVQVILSHADELVPGYADVAAAIKQPAAEDSAGWPIAQRLYLTQRRSIEALWQRATSEGEARSERRRGPGRGTEGRDTHWHSTKLVISERTGRHQECAARPT